MTCIYSLPIYYLHLLPTNLLTPCLSHLPSNPCPSITHSFHICTHLYHLQWISVYSFGYHNHFTTFSHLSKVSQHPTCPATLWCAASTRQSHLLAEPVILWVAAQPPYGVLHRLVTATCSYPMSSCPATLWCAASTRHSHLLAEPVILWVAAQPPYGVLHRLVTATCWLNQLSYG